MANSTTAMDGFVPELRLSPGAIAVPVLSFITLLLDVPSVIWHIKNRNLPATCLVSWIIISNVMNVINALLWPNDNIPMWYDGVGLCDVEVKLDLAATLGIVGALACIMRSLARALNTKKTVANLTKAERQRKNLFDITLCFGPPIYLMLVHYIVQPSRYYIFAISGCTPSVDNSWPSVALIYIWPLLLCLVVANYSILVIHRLRIYRRDFAAILSSSSSGLNQSRFLRLFILALTLIVLILPVQAYVLYSNALFPLQPYSWTRIHSPGWNSIIMIPTGGAVVFDRWIRLALGFVVFACFGTGRDATKMYTAWLRTLGFAHLFPALKPHPAARLAPFKTARSSATSTSTTLPTPSPSSPAQSFAPLRPLRSGPPTSIRRARTERNFAENMRHVRIIAAWLARLRARFARVAPHGDLESGAVGTEMAAAAAIAYEGHVTGNLA